MLLVWQVPMPKEIKGSHLNAYEWHDANDRGEESFEEATCTFSHENVLSTIPDAFFLCARGVDLNREYCPYQIERIGL